MKLKTVILPLLCLFFITAKSQEKRLYFSAYTTFDYSNITPEKTIDHRGKFSFGLGIQANYKFTERIEGILGVGYIDKGHREKSIDPGPTDDIEVFKSANRHTNLSIPIKIQYNFTLSKNKIYSALGIENDIFLAGSGGFYERSFAQSFVINFGWSTPISEKLKLGFEPTFRYPLTPYTNDKFNSVEIYPYAIGLKVILSKSN